MNGYKVSDKNDDSKFIFLPAAGNVVSVNPYDEEGEGIYGFYWSSDDASYLFFSKYKQYMSSGSCSPSEGLPVRPVSE